MLFIDLDGTVLDVRARHYATYVELLRSDDLRGVPVPEREYWHLRRESRSVDELLKMSRLFPTKYARFKERFDARLETPEMLLLDEPRVGVETFNGKAYTKTPIVLVTARRDGVALDNQLRRLGLRRFFVEVLHGAPRRSARPARPDKDARALHRAGLVRARYKLPPTEALLIGDTETDVQIARAFGWDVFLVEGGHRSKAKQVKANPDRIVADLPAALTYLLPGGRWQR